MPIELVPHDPEWFQSFEHARDELIEQLGSDALRAVEHIGSTSVPELYAKPIVDIAAGVDDLDTVTALADRLSELGYVPWWGGDGRVSFQRRNRCGQPTHNLHIVVYEGPNWRRYLSFRDRLRASGARRAEYERLKRNLAASFDDSREYSEAKTDFVRDVIESGKGD